MALEFSQINFPAERDVIEQVLPHRDPFVWVSRILQCDPGVSCTGELYVDPELPLFKGHFPDHPVFPGVLLMEALAQTGSFAVMVAPENQGRVGFFGAMENVKFRNQVQPGDTVLLKTEVLKSNKRMVKAHCEAYVDDVLCAQADQMYVMG